MNKQNSTIRPRQVKKYFRVMMVAWTLLIIAIMVRDYRLEYENIIKIAQAEAQGYHDKDKSLRLFIASKGGVYIPASALNPPDPRMELVGNRDVITSSGLRLTLMSPAAMMSELKELNPGLLRDDVRVTSFRPIRVENAPDYWEQKALMTFKEGKTEAFEFNETSADPYVRLMKPLFIGEECVKCHGYEKGNIGEVGGGISVIVPIGGLVEHVRAHVLKSGIGIGLIWLLGLLGLGFGGRNISNYLREIEEVTDQLTAKEKESSSRMALFEAMFNSITPDAAVFLDMKRRIIMANKIFYERTGYTSEEVFGNTCELFYADPMLFDEMSRIYEDDADNQVTLPYEMEYKMKDGSVIQTETMASLVKREDGEILGCLALIRDISDRKKSDTEMQQILERKRAAEIAANAGSWSWDVITGDLEWSGNLCRIHGIECQEFEGKLEGIMKYIHPHDRWAVRYEYMQIMREKKPRELRYRIITPDGVEKFLLSDTNLAFNDKGELEKIVGMMRDVTEMQKIERERELNQERLSILLQLNEMLDSSKEEIIQFGLNGCIRMTGSNSGYFQCICCDDTLGSTSGATLRWAGDLWTDCETSADIKNVLRTAGIRWDDIGRDKPVINNSGGDESIEVDPEKRTLVNRYLSVPIIDDNHLVAIIWVANKKDLYDETDIRQVNLLVKGMINLIQRKNDLMKKRELEYHLQRAGKMEAMGTLASGIAHDFNNILAIIFVSAEVALKNIPMDNPARKKMERIIKASDRAKDIVDQILLFSRQAENKKIKISPVNIVRDSLKLMKPTTPSTIEFVEEINPDNGLIEADPTQIHQVIMNLFTNAIQAMGEKGKIKVSSSIVEMSEEQLFFKGNFKPGRYFKFSVKDDGLGMDELTKERIFDPFFTTKEVGEGTGMGLSIVMGIVSSHNGFIDVESEPGEGATFDVYFPLIDQIEKHEETVTVQHLYEKEGKIMLVDDEEVLAEITGEMLKMEGYQISVQTDSINALEEFRSAPDEFDLVITDHTMPKMTGLEFAKELLEIRPGLPVILLTGYNKKISKDDVLNIGIKEYLHKPFEREVLVNTIAKVIFESRGVVPALRN